MGVGDRIGVVLSATAVAAVGAVGVWMGLAATSVPTVDLGATVYDTVTISTSTGDAGIALEWRLRREGDVVLTASMADIPLAVPADFPLAESADIAIQLSCDARLADFDLPRGVTVIEDGDESECGSDPTFDGMPARQVFQTTLRDEPIEITGRPIRAWSTSLAGQSTSRSPELSFMTGGYFDPAFPAPTDPGPYSTLTVILEAGPSDLLDLTVAPSGEVVESTSVTVQQDGDRVWVDSVMWSFTFERFDLQTDLDEGLARWTDPSGQTFMQLLLLLSGALIGVAASLAVERLFAWTLAIRGARMPAADAASTPPADGEGAPPEGDAP